MPTSSVAFLSYAHRDDAYHGGAITKLRDELSGAISVAIGEDFSIFQDRQGIAWGEHWPSKLEQGLAGGRFLIAVLSPSFFKSHYCRKELSEFLKIERAAGRKDLILPIYFRTTSLLENQLKCDDDPLAKAIAERQYRDWRELRHLPFNDYKVRRALDSLADELVQALDRRGPALSEDERLAGSFATPFADQVGTYETGALEGPGEFRAQGLMDQQAPFVSNSISSLPEPGTVFRDVDEPWCPEMVVIPPGSFIMGSSPDEEGHDPNEEPEHRVRIEKPFALGIYPVTFDQFDHFSVETGRRKPVDHGFGRGTRPVITVNAEDAEAYLVWLSSMTGKSYSLPSEAIWEYACRAGTKTPFSTGATISTEQANFFGLDPYGNAEMEKFFTQSIEVGKFPANPFGLFDMHGNVWEWCADPWHESYEGGPRDGAVWLNSRNHLKQVIRGGSWRSAAREVRSAQRNWHERGNCLQEIGFRCARFQVS